MSHFVQGVDRTCRRRPPENVHTVPLPFLASGRKDPKRLHNRTRNFKWLPKRQVKDQTRDLIVVATYLIILD